MPKKGFAAALFAILIFAAGVSAAAENVNFNLDNSGHIAVEGQTRYVDNILTLGAYAGEPKSRFEKLAAEYNAEIAAYRKSEKYGDEYTFKFDRAYSLSELKELKKEFESFDCVDFCMIGYILFDGHAYIAETRSGADGFEAAEILERMRANSEAWHTAGKPERERLAAENLELGASIGAVRNDASGVWYTDARKLTKLYDLLAELYD